MEHMPLSRGLGFEGRATNAKGSMKKDDNSRARRVSRGRVCKCAVGEEDG